MKIIAFAASNSKNSINKMLVTYAANLIENAEVEILDLNDFEMPLFSIDREEALGSPAQVAVWVTKLASADAILVSFAEHNGNVTAAYKNLFDWVSRVERNFYQNKPVIVLSTSPGQRGGASVMEVAKASIPRAGGDIKGVLSIPSFHQNFSIDLKSLTNPELDQALKALLLSLSI